MIKINVNKKKTIEFDVNVMGVQCEALSGRLSLFYEDIIYSFPATIDDENTIKIKIPVLNDIINDIPDKATADLKLEVVGNETFMMPWTGTALLEHPVNVEATMRGTQKLVEEETPKVEIGEIREEEQDEKACPEGQQWCPIQKKCVTPPRNEEEDDLDEKKKWVTDCDYCGEITMVRSHGGGKGCEHCIKKGSKPKKKDSPKTWAGALMKAAKEPVKPRKKKKKTKLGEALTGEAEDKKRRKLKSKKLGKALAEALLDEEKEEKEE